MAKRKTVWEDCDILVVGGGMAGTGGTIKDSGTATRYYYTVSGYWNSSWFNYSCSVNRIKL